MKRITFTILLVMIAIVAMKGQDNTVDYNNAKQAFSRIKNITLLVKESDFNSDKSVNFLYGEFIKYLESLGYAVKINHYFTNGDAECINAAGQFYFSSRQTLTSSGIWKYNFSNLEFVFVTSCSEDDKNYGFKIGSFIVDTTPNSLYEKLKAIRFLRN